MAGRGSVRKRVGTTGHVSWRVVYDLAPDAEGNRRQSSKTFATKRQADAFLTERQRERDTGTALDPTRLTASELVTRWLDTRAGDLRATSEATYRGWLRKHLDPALGSVPIQKLSPAHVAALMAALRQAGLSPQYARRVRWLLSSALAQAVEWRMIPRNVAAPERTRPVRRVKAIPPHWDRDTARAFAAAVAGDDAATPYLLMLATGLRRGECCALRWSDLDLDRAMLTVARTRVELKGRATEHPPKGGRPRTLDLDVDTIALLRDHRRRTPTPLGGAGYVFAEPPLALRGVAYPGGRAITFTSLKHRFDRLVARHGLPALPLHGLRHTHATILLQEGVHPKVVQERLGHANIGMTLDTYSHVVPGLGRAAADAIGRALRPPAVTTVAEDVTHP
jgi:integrase